MISSMGFFSFFSSLYFMCCGTLRPLCCVGLKFCSNVDASLLFSERPSRVHRCGIL